MPSKYMFLVNSRQTASDDATWEKWYTEEHLPDLVKAGAATRAAVYRETKEVPSLLEHNKEKNFPRSYLAVYQTDHEQLLNTEQYQGVRTTSELFPGSKKAIHDNGEFDARNYTLVDVFDPKNIGDTPSPKLLYAELDYEDGEHLKKFYNEEHFPLLGKVKGYRRGLRYQIGPNSPLMLTTPAKFLALHEWDEEHGMERTPEMDAVTQTPWTLRVMSDVKFSVIRTFELIGTAGY